MSCAPKAPRATPCCRSPTSRASTSPGCSRSSRAETSTATCCSPACSTWLTSTRRCTGICVTSPTSSARAWTRCSVTATTTRQSRAPEPGWRWPERMVAPAAIYVHRIGRTVGQVLDEHRLREAVESYLDPPDTIPAQLTAAEAHGRVRSFALRRDDLRWARLGPRRVGLCPPRPGPGAPGGPAACRADPAPSAAARRRGAVPADPPPRAHGCRRVRPGSCRARPRAGASPRTMSRRTLHCDRVGQGRPAAAPTMRGVLMGLDTPTATPTTATTFAGVRTIHFARWVPVDDGRRPIFACSYDGTPESHMDDFIDRCPGPQRCLQQRFRLSLDPLADPRRCEGRQPSRTICATTRS